MSEKKKIATKIKGEQIEKVLRDALDKADKTEKEIQEFLDAFLW